MTSTPLPSPVLAQYLRDLAPQIVGVNPHNPRDTGALLARIYELIGALEAERCLPQAALLGAAASVIDALMRQGGMSVDDCLGLVQRLARAADFEGLDGQAMPPALPQTAAPAPMPYGAPPGYWMPHGAPPGYGYPPMNMPLNMPPMQPMPYGMPAAGYPGYGVPPGMAQPGMPPPALPQAQMPQAPPQSGAILKGGASFHTRTPGQAQPNPAPNYGPTPGGPAPDGAGLQLVNHRKLGEILVSMAMVSQEDLDRALRAQKANGKRLGDVLVSMGLLTKEMIESAVRLQKQRNAGNNGVDFNRPQFKQRGG